MSGNNNDINLKGCWHRIGVWGSEIPRCQRLDEVIHCQNCDVFHEASLKVYEKPLPDGYRKEWTEALANDKAKAMFDTRSVIILRLGDEWVAISTTLCKEISSMLKIHRLPHNKSQILRGVVNSGGEIRVCFSLGSVLGIAKAERVFGEGSYAVFARMVVMEIEGSCYVFPTSEIGGLHHYRKRELEELPKTVLASAATYMKGIIKWKDKNVGCLDGDMLISQLERSINING